jgi:glycosyltransferase involved in cell wall biosynthesis
MKIYYWSPYLTNIATINSVRRSAKSLIKYGKSKNISEVGILNSIGEWSFKKKNFSKVKIINLHPFNFFSFLPKEGFIQSRFSFIIIFLINFFPLIFLMKRKKPKYFIIHLLTILPIILSPLLSKNTKIILRISGLPELTFFRTLIWKIFSNYIYKVTVPTKTTLKFLKDTGIFNKKKVSLLRDPIIDSNEIFKKKFMPIENKFKKKKFIVSIGRLTNQKNFEFLIKMFSKYKKKFFADHLLIIGSGEDKIKLQETISNLKCQNYIHLIGFRKNVYKYIYRSKALFSSALYEDPGFSIIEAAYLKKKIITSLVKNGPIEMKKNGNLCFFFKVNNEKSFLNVLKKAKNINQKKIVNAKKFSENFSTYNHYKNLIRILI